MMYDPEYTQAFYDTYGAAEWARLEATAHGRLKAIIHNDFIKKYVKVGDRVLDTGCGPGRFSISIARLGGQVTLLDISREQLLLAREKLKDSGLLERVKGLIHGDIANLSMFPDGYFDAVLCYGGALS